MARDVAHLRLVMPAGMDRLDAVEALAGDEVLTKARRKYGKRTFARERALEGVLARFRSSYDALLDRLFRQIVRYIGEEIVGEPVEKSADTEIGRKIGLLTPQQLETIKSLIRDHHLAFAAGAVGPDAIPAADLARLHSTGLVPTDLKLLFKPGQGDPSVQTMRVTDLAFQYGTVLGDARQKDALREMSARQFEAHLERTKPDLNPVEQQAMSWARFNAGQHIQGMGDRIALETGTVVANADAEQRRRYLGSVQEATESVIERRASWRELASDIGHATEDWSRDMQRVAATEMQFAMQEAQATAIAKGADDPEDVNVAKIPAPDACPDCIRLHLTAGPGSPPRIFKLSELQANGTNVGRKRRGWKATVGPVHPWCGCELEEVPEGWGYDAEGDLVPEILIEKADTRLEDTEELVKAEIREHMTHRDAVPDNTLIVRVSDPVKRQVIERVLEEAPQAIFARDVGVTLITTDHPRAQNPLDDGDYAYWTANEIRLSQTIEVERIPRVLRHELGHSLNVWLMHQLGDLAAVRAWHDQLWALSEEEGFVSDYAKKLPIENAAEVTRMYLFERGRLMLNHPQQFAFCHRHYKAIFRRGSK